MATRSYRLGRRGEAAEETRRRIVDATFSLHNEQGVVATTMKQIAERAGVSVGTVYHHFPSYEDAIRACGEHVIAFAPPPDPAAIAGIEDRVARIGRLTEAVFGFYERLPGFARVRCDQGQVPIIHDFVRREEENRASLVRAALGASAPEDRVRAVAAVLDIAVYQSLVREGFTTRKAATDIARMIVTWLDDAEAATTRRQ
ncbi:MAG: TetR/AcrR family transcriptional regulator [Alphaproteobacteria bacterium]